VNPAYAGQLWLLAAHLMQVDNLLQTNNSHVVTLLWETLNTMKIAMCTKTCENLRFKMQGHVMHL